MIHFVPVSKHDPLHYEMPCCAAWSNALLTMVQPAFG